MLVLVNFNYADATSTNTTAPQVKSVNPVNHSIIQKSQTIKITFSKSIKIVKNSAILKNSAGKTISTYTRVNGNTMVMVPKTKLTVGKYFITIKEGTVKDLDENTNQLYNSYFTVSPITLAQMKDGKARTENFYAKNGRLPNYVSFGSKNIKITEFQKILATQNLKINTTVKVKSYSITKSAGCSAYNISLSSKTVSSSSKCSCGSCGDYVYHTRTYKNYCPNCHRYGTLKWNPKGVYEGEWTCSHCDCDYCAACGKEKIHNHPKHLIKA